MKACQFNPMKTMSSPFLTVSSGFPAAPFPQSQKQDRRAAGKAAPVPAVAGPVQLAKDQVIRLDRRSRVSGLAVQRGRVWITETPANRDLVAEEGGYVKLQGGWPVVVQALTEVTLVFSRKGEL